MAKKKNPATETADAAIATAAVITSTAELTGDGANPRKISDESKAGLRASIKRFGDLSGIVFNKRTGELVAGHQRMEQIRAEYGESHGEGGELPIVPTDETAGLFGIRIDEHNYFPVRVVDWSKAKQRAANVAANNAKIQGAFTKDLSEYLLSVEAELTAEMPGILDDCLMLELMAAGLDTSDATEKVEFEAGNQAVPTLFQVVVECSDEQSQKSIYDRLTAEGHTVKLLTI